MLAAIVRGSLASPKVVTTLSLLIALLGVGALLSARLDVFPDFAPPHLLVQAEAPGLDATQVESMVTRPLEDLLAGAENVEAVRSSSSQGLSAIQVVFGRDSDPYLQRQVISERLADAATLLPPGVGAPQLSPLSSSMEYLLHFGFTSDQLSPVELRDLVRWTIKPQILSVPGVAQAQLFGGDARERQLWIDPARLQALNLSLEDVFEATRRGTQMAGGGFLETPTQRIVLQAQPPGASLEALGETVIASRAGVPVRLADVAQLRDGAAPRFGDAIIAGKAGILVETSTQYGANTLEVTRQLEERLQTLAPQLAARGVTYHPALLRPASFIESAIGKLRNSLLIGALLVVVLLLLTLRDWRGALISFGAIPVSLLATVWLLSLGGLSLNTMSLGGLVVALGVVVDDAVIDVENITRRRRSAAAGTDLRRLLLDASLEVRRPVFYATAAVAVAFLPILMLSGLQGAFFRPLATAFLLAVGLSLLVAMSATPALCALLMHGYQVREEPGWLRRCKAWQRAAITHLARYPRSVLALILASGALGLALLPLLGARLLPDFRENYLIAHAALRPGISLAETSRVGERIVQRLTAIPGVKSVAEQIGRAENGQDPDAPNKSEFEIQLDPGRGVTTEQLEARVRAAFDQFPNQLVEIYSVLAERIGETLSGEVAPFFVSVFGPDLDRNDEVAGAIAELLRKWPQSGTVRLEVPPRQPELQLQMKPAQLALYGLEATDVLAAVNAAYHGTLVAQLNQADRSVPVVARLSTAGATPQDVGRLPLRSRDGALVPLEAVATLTMVSARSMVEHEDGLRRQVVVASPHGADQAGYARAAEQAIAAHVKLPPNVYLRYGGTAPAQAAAARELIWHSAAALVLIVLLLALAFGHSRHVLLVFAALPSTLIGGVAAVALTGGTLSLGAMVGFVALFGMAARNTILLISHYEHLITREGVTWSLETALRGSEERLTPVLLTALLTALALLPVALQSREAGHEIEGPMAVVILGGLVSSTFVSLVLVPPLAARWLGHDRTSPVGPP
ncbi:MAG TPA: efflux RND transporter permease subunit [Steroidobacteraceae bacterium]|jgi:CzcA family heavy metal efflux pump|nr:efflux RND transporter permease subunit [Steroidobacteraceae bacterium]